MEVTGEILVVLWQFLVLRTGDFRSLWEVPRKTPSARLHSWTLSDSEERIVSLPAVMPHR